MKKLLFLFYSLFFLNGYAQFSGEHIITTEAPLPIFVHAADLNGDGLKDVIAAEIEGNKIAWYENLEEAGSFGEKQIIADDETEYRFISTADIDGDGDLDILSTALYDDFVVWFENLDGLGNFSNRKNIASSLDHPLIAAPYDIDDDGDIDVVSASYSDGRILWYENLDGQGDFLLAQTITHTATTPQSVFITDLDNDDDPDILTESSSNNNQPAWHENLDGLGDFGTEQVFTNDTLGANNIIAADIDGDGDMDPILIEYGPHIISWFENDGFGNFGAKKIITTNVEYPHQIFAADIDNDGDLDLVSVSSGDEKIAWYKNLDGLGNFGEQQIISLSAQSPRSIDVADFDNDGDLDIVSASLYDNKLVWYENYTILGVEENLVNKIEIYPNPVKNILFINNYENLEIEKVKIFDVLGRMVLLENNPKSQLDISNLAKGLLFVKLETSKGILTKKLIKE